MSRIAQLLCIWLGPTMIVLFLIGSVWLAKYFPPAIHPSESANEVASFYADNVDRIRIGLVLHDVRVRLHVLLGRRDGGADPAQGGQVPDADLRAAHRHGVRHRADRRHGRACGPCRVPAR